MKTGAWAGVFLFLGVATVQSEEPFLILSGAGGGSIEIGQRICSDDDLYFHHDGSFELGIGWEYLGVAPPYDGAFGEAYELGPGAVNCVSLWLSEGGDWYTGQTTDVYVWEGGVAGSPGNVLAMVGGIMGVLFGMLGSLGITTFSEMTAPVSVSSVVLSFGFAALVGVFFGLYPARKASKLNPIDALRYE